MPLSVEQKRLTLRQLYEIQAMADQVNGSTDFETTAEAFNGFSQEMKAFIFANVSNEMVLERLEKIEKVEFISPTWHFLYFILLPFWAMYIIKNHFAKEKCKEKIKEVASIYSSIHFILKAEWN